MAWIAVMEISLFIFGGDIVRAYLLDYAIEEVPGDGAVTTMSISNIGLLQSADTVAIIAMNGTGTALEARCPEGASAEISGQVVVVAFVHMTPGVPCEIDVASDIAPPLLAQFTSRGMPEAEVVEGWGRTHGGWNPAIFSIIAGQALIIAFLTLMQTDFIRDKYWSARPCGYRKSRHADEIADYVRRAYRLKVDHRKASIIEALADGDSSAVRIAAALPMPLPRVQALLRRMRDDGLLGGDGGLDPALRAHVAGIGGGAAARAMTLPDL